MSVDIHDVITCATFCDDRLRGLGVARPRFPIDLRSRPYNTLPCDKERFVSFYAMAPLCVIIPHEYKKKQDTLPLPITLAVVDRFSNFFSLSDSELNV